MRGVCGSCLRPRPGVLEPEGSVTGPALPTLLPCWGNKVYKFEQVSVIASVLSHSSCYRAEPEASPLTHLFEQTSILSLSGRRGSAGTGWLGVTLLPAAVTLAGVVALLLSCRGVVPPLVRPAAVPLPRSFSGQTFSWRVGEGTWMTTPEVNDLSTVYVNIYICVCVRVSLQTLCVWHKAKHCGGITFLSAGIIPVFRLKLRWQKHRSLFIILMCQIYTENDKLWGLDAFLSFFLSLAVSLCLIDVERAAGCSAISPRSTHKSAVAFYLSNKAQLLPSSVNTKRHPAISSQDSNRSCRQSPDGKQRLWPRVFILKTLITIHYENQHAKTWLGNYQISAFVLCQTKVILGGNFMDTVTSKI